jgi:hypothetical protein
MLISVHIPKTGGTAFGELLAARFGPALLRDYDDRPLSHPAAFRLGAALVRMPAQPARVAGFDAAHGHFLALKYLAVPGDVVTWLRDPAQRVVSRYHHYRRDVAEGRPLQRVSGLRSGLDLAAFIELPRFQDTMAKYFAGFPLRRVSCFGFSEDMAEGLARMRRVTGLELGAPVLANANPARGSEGYDIPEALRRRIEKLNPGDYRLWNEARAREGV